MTDRYAHIAAFLAAHQWGGVEIKPLAGDASFRRYFRLTGETKRAVLMDAPPPKENVRIFADLSRHLRSLGLTAPEILAEDRQMGLLLLEDLGDDTYTRILAAGGDERMLYQLAVNVLIHLHRRPQAEVIPDRLPPYDDDKLLEEACLLTDWYMPAMLGAATPDEIRDAYCEAWLSAFPVVHAQPRTLVLRDYHVDNLMWLPTNDGVRACGLLDFQDALAGPGAYDLMSLLEDARRDIDPRLVSDMIDHYLNAFPGFDEDDFRAAFAILAAQRHAKVIGIFTRLCMRDAKPVYLAHIPRVWRLLEQTLKHPALAGVAEWIDSHIAEDRRGIPPCR